MLKGVLEGREMNSGDQVEEVIATVWNKLTFNEVQNVFDNGMSHLAWVIGNEGESTIK
jgi:hypothetical protein